MATNQSEIDRFHQFATAALTGSDSELSLEDLLLRWREQQSETETIASIQRGIEDTEAGRVHTLEEVDSRIRRELGFSERNR